MIFGECVMTEAIERKKHCVNICIKKQCQSNQGVNKVNKGIVVLGTIQPSYSWLQTRDDNNCFVLLKR